MAEAAKTENREGALPEKGKVESVCKKWLVHEDGVLAYKLQNEEMDFHYGLNRYNRRTVREDIPVAKLVQSEEELRQQRERMEQLMLLKSQAEEDEKIAQHVMREIDSEEAIQKMRAELTDEEFARKMHEKEKRRFERWRREQELKKERERLEQELARHSEEARLVINRGEGGEEAAHVRHSSGDLEHVRVTAGGRIEDEGDFSDFYIPPADHMEEGEKKQLQELQDEELARLLQEQEHKRTKAEVDRDKLKQIEQQDAQLARVIHEQDKLKAKKLKQRRQKSTEDAAKQNVSDGSQRSDDQRHGRDELNMSRVSRNSLEDHNLTHTSGNSLDERGSAHVGGNSLDERGSSDVGGNSLDERGSAHVGGNSLDVVSSRLGANSFDGGSSRVEGRSPGRVHSSPHSNDSQGSLREHNGYGVGDELINHRLSSSPRASGRSPPPYHHRPRGGPQPPSALPNQDPHEVERWLGRNQTPPPSQLGRSRSQPSPPGSYDSEDPPSHRQAHPLSHTTSAPVQPSPVRYNNIAMAIDPTYRPSSRDQLQTSRSLDYQQPPPLSQTTHSESFTYEEEPEEDYDEDDPSWAPVQGQRRSNNDGARRSTKKPPGKKGNCKQQ